MEIIINEMMADDGTGTTGPWKYWHARCEEMTLSDSDTNNDMSYDDVCAIAWKRVQSRQGNKKGPNGLGSDIVGKELMN